MDYDLPDGVELGAFGVVILVIILALIYAVKKVFCARNPAYPEQSSQILNVGSHSVSMETNMNDADNTNGAMLAETVSTRQCESSPILECNTHRKMVDVHKKPENIFEPQVETLANPDTVARCKLHTVEGKHKINVASNDGACSSNECSKDKTASREKACNIQKENCESQRNSFSSTNKSQLEQYVINASHALMLAKKSSLRNHAYSYGERDRLRIQIGRRRLSNDSGFDERDREETNNLDSSVCPGKMISLNEVSGQDAECYV